MFYRYFLTPLVLIVLAALALAHNSRAAGAIPPRGSGKPLNSKQWDAVLNQGDGAKIIFGVSLGGPSAFARAEEQTFPTASLAKLFTAGVALDRLGPAFRFETRVTWNTPLPQEMGKISDLTLIGSGDPTWGMMEWGETPGARFNQIALALKNAGVREAHGDIHFTAQDPRWDHPAAPAGWLPEDLNNCDGSVPQAFNLQINCATLVIQDPTHSHWAERGLSTPVQLAIVPGDVTELDAKLDGVGFKITGTWSASTPKLRLWLPVPDAAQWARALLLRSLAANGIQVVPKSRMPAASPNSAAHSISFYSPPLNEILRPMLKKSLNMVAEAIFFTLGLTAEIPSKDLISGAQQVMQDYLSKTLPNETSTALLDGSGLSRTNTSTPRAIRMLLEALSKSQDFPAFWNMLPIAGVDGTLASRMKGSSAEGILRAKTGTLRGYYHLAGFVPRFNAIGTAEEYVPFVVMAHSKPQLIRAAREAQDRVGIELVRESNH